MELFCELEVFIRGGGKFWRAHGLERLVRVQGELESLDRVVLFVHEAQGARPVTDTVNHFEDDDVQTRPQVNALDRLTVYSQGADERVVIEQPAVEIDSGLVIAPDLQAQALALLRTSHITDRVGGDSTVIAGPDETIEVDDAVFKTRFLPTQLLRANANQLPGPRMELRLSGHLFVANLSRQTLARGHRDRSQDQP